MASFESSLALRFPGRANRWQLRTRELELGARPLVMGIVNVDAGQFLGRRRVFRSRGRDCPRAGISGGGGRSAGRRRREHAALFAAGRGRRRIAPRIAGGRCAVCSGGSACVDRYVEGRCGSGSVGGRGRNHQRHHGAGRRSGNDRRSARNRRRGRGNAHARQAANDAGSAALRATSWPRFMGFFAGGAMRLIAAGIRRERIALDPGIGFGKTHAHNLALVANCWRVA